MRSLALLLLAIPVLAASKGKLEPPKRAERNGWIVVRLSGTREQIGRQHGQLPAADIADSYRVVKLRKRCCGHRSTPSAAWKAAA